MTRTKGPRPARIECVDMRIPPELQDALWGALRPEMRTLEAGCGLSTEYFEAAGCDHIALEHENQYAIYDSCLVRPLTGDPPWYDYRPTGPFDLVLIDAPPGWIGRQGILRVFDLLVHPATIVFLDNSNRPDENALASAIAARWPCTVERVHCEYGGEYAVFKGTKEST